MVLGAFRASQLYPKSVKSIENELMEYYHEKFDFYSDRSHHFPH
jgi:ribosomal protein S17E